MGDPLSCTVLNYIIICTVFSFKSLSMKLRYNSSLFDDVFSDLFRAVGSPLLRHMFFSCRAAADASVKLGGRNNGKAG